MKVFGIFLVLSFGLLSCHSAKDTPSASITLRFIHTVNGIPLELDTRKYVNENGDTFDVAQFDYYLSNLRFFSDGRSFRVPNSYHLIRVRSSGHIVELTINGVPALSYDRIEFGIGVDSIANGKTDKVGDLDPNNAMAWNWLTGYKFVRLEGKHYRRDGTIGGLVFHIGKNENYKTVSLAKPFSSQVPLEISVDVSEMFKSPHLIDFSLINEAMFGPEASLVAENYVDMFR